MAQKIFVVEDDKFLRELMCEELKREGFFVGSAIDGEEGLEKIPKEIPDLVLLDLILPGIDGFEVLKRLKENPYVSKVPVIILSNLGQKDNLDKGMSLGAADYLIKAHFTPREIIERIKTMFK
jgi:DNA-binding response OmpR family regulator